MVGFRETAEDRLSRRIWRLLDSRRAMRIGEMQVRLGVSAAAIHAALGAMIASGEVVRLRPINCSGEDHDFFRLNRPPPATARMETEMAAVYADVKLWMQPRGAAMAAHLLD